LKSGSSEGKKIECTLVLGLFVKEKCKPSRCEIFPDGEYMRARTAVGEGQKKLPRGDLGSGKKKAG